MNSQDGSSERQSLDGGNKGIALDSVNDRPARHSGTERITLAHGSGGRATAELIAAVFRPRFTNPCLDRLEDGACLPRGAATDTVIATDSHVVSPLFFPGGDIGTLAVNGTVNDVAMAGGRCRYMSAAFIIEEGFAISALCRIVDSMADAARKAGVLIVAGDTKVVERGKGDGLFICTTGVGEVLTPNLPGCQFLQAGDRIILSGDIGRHGATITALRQGPALVTDLASDCAPLASLVEAMLATGAAIRCLRDPTRGGVAAVLNEWCDQAGVGIRLDETAVPVAANVAALCDLLGLDPWYLACEGRLLCACDATAVPDLLAAMRGHTEGRDACVIGEVIAAPAGLVQVTTAYGGRRLLDWRWSDPLPRIC